MSAPTPRVKRKPLNNEAKWNSFNHWAISFIVCNFNVDVGPEIELVYPEGTPYTSNDLSAICFNSFPERHETDSADDVFFHFTIRNNSPDIRLSSPGIPHGSSTYFHGNSAFRQEYDAEKKRSFNQKSLVIISNHEFPALFAKVLLTITRGSQISDPARLEAAASDIASWPPPRVGRSQLPLLGSMLTLEIPPHQAFPLQGLHAPADGHTEALIYAYEPHGQWHSLLPYFQSLHDLYTTFEKLFLGESIVVLARSPQQCSATVSALVDLIKPVPYGGMKRPYLTMQSADIFGGANDTGLPRHYIIGITNPFLLKRIITATENSGYAFPHIVHLKEYSGPAPPLKLNRSLRGNHHHSQYIDIPGGLELPPPAKRHLKSDADFLSQLELLTRDRASSTTMIDSLVRRHFADMAAQLLSPINRFLATHMNSSSHHPKDNSSPIEYANFNAAALIKTLAKNGPSVKWRGTGPLQTHKARDSFYEAFCESQNFFSWLEMKVTLETEARAGLMMEEKSHGLS